MWTSKWVSKTLFGDWLAIDTGDGERQTVTAARTRADGRIEIIGICEFTGDADSDGGECD